MKKILKVLLIILSVIIGIVLILLLYIRIMSPGKLPPLTDANGKVIENSLSEKLKIQIGGIEQGIFIRSENPANPVILYLHGGPGSPELPLIMPYEQPERLEKYFTVCYWDQRGAGMTYSTTTDPATMTLEQMVEDTRQVTQYLIDRFGKEKIYLIGHSWGSYLGIKVVEKHPHYYHAYAGVGQVTDQRQSEILAYQYMRQHAQEINDKKSLKLLEEYNMSGPNFLTFDYLMKVRTPMMNKYGIGIMHENMNMAKVVMDVFTFKGYTTSEKNGYAKGNIYSYDYLFDQYVLADNMFQSSPCFDAPVYVLHGKYDYQVSYALAKDYIDAIEAPEKGFYTFEHSAHSPNMEEPEKFVQAIKDIARKYTPNP